MKTLTERQRILLREADEYTISDTGGVFYRLGGSGTLSLRYDGASYPALERRGLVARQGGGCWKTTEAGRSALRDNSSP